MNILKIALFSSALIFAGAAPSFGGNGSEGNGDVNTASYSAPEGNGHVGDTAFYAQPEGNGNFVG